MRQKKCRVCGVKFDPLKPMQVVCSPACARTHGKKTQAKAQKKETAEKRKQMETLPELRKKAQAAFNAYIRYRDKDKPCICCGKPLGESDSGGAYDAGHYRSTGSAPHLRFDERNCHAQRKYCNRYGAGRAVDYRLGLIARIGQAEVDALESDQTPRHYNKDDLRKIAKTYRQKLRDMKGSE